MKEVYQAIHHVSNGPNGQLPVTGEKVELSGEDFLKLKGAHDKWFGKREIEGSKEQEVYIQMLAEYDMTHKDFQTLNLQHITTNALTEERRKGFSSRVSGALDESKERYRNNITKIGNGPISEYKVENKGINNISKEDKDKLIKLFNEWGRNPDNTELDKKYAKALEEYDISHTEVFTWTLQI